MSSKKKRRYEEYLKRKAKRDQKETLRLRRGEVLKSGSIEEMAKLYGIPLR